MRLSVVNEKHRSLKHRIMFRIMPLIMGVKVPDVMKVLTFRMEYFGETFGRMVHEAMRGTSDWTAAERELFAAFTARVHECRF